MARSSKPGESFPFSLVRKEISVTDTDQKIQEAAEAAKDVASQAADDVAEQLRALREQVRTLQATVGDIAARTGKVVAGSARVATDKVTESARATGDKAMAGAKVARVKVADTVETYPVSALLITAGTAFLLGRLTASSQRPPSYADYAENAIGNIRHKLQDLSSQLPPHLKSALRSSLR